MRCRKLLVLGMIAVLATSCATRQLWKATDPEEYVSVPQGEVSEAELQARSVKYRKDGKRGVYYVEKSNLRRLGDYSIRLFGAPVTVVLDAASSVVVVGAAFVVIGAGVAVENSPQMLKSLDRSSQSGWRKFDPP